MFSCSFHFFIADGYGRSETVAVVFLQKLKDAKRVYAEVVHAKTNCDGYKEEGMTHPSVQMQQSLLEELYEECEIEPNSLSFIEAHGTGTEVRTTLPNDYIASLFVCPYSWVLLLARSSN